MTELRDCPKCGRKPHFGMASCYEGPCPGAYNCCGFRTKIPFDKEISTILWNNLVDAYEAGRKDEKDNHVLTQTYYDHGPLKFEDCQVINDYSASTILGYEIMEGGEVVLRHTFRPNKMEDD